MDHLWIKMMERGINLLIRLLKIEISIFMVMENKQEVFVL